MHVHSQFSESHVEFGLPVQVIGKLSAAFGLDFACITDHSYDLSTSMNDYLRTDRSAPRWSAFMEQMGACTEPDILLVPGDEIS